ncbi:hypothetical protein DU99_08570 [Sinorhizobium meliloti]|nr:hypothetical protein DU99_08570 [Sinorhizobium meliloti]
MLHTNNPFRSPLQRISWSNKLADELERGAAEFLRSKPFQQVSEKDSNGNELQKIRFTAAIPDDLSNLAADAADSLRQALDQTAYACAAAVKQNPKRTHFPFGGDPESVERALSNGQSSDIPRELAQVIIATRPHKKGDVLLWGLNRLRNVNQHRLLEPIGIVAGLLNLNIERASGSAQIQLPQWDAEKREIVLAKIGQGSKLIYRVDVSFDLAFGNVELFSGQPAVPILRRLSARVSRIVQDISQEAFRLGILQPEG